MNDFKVQRVSPRGVTAEVLDCDVAALYGVETRVANQVVKNSPEKFPMGYIVELSSDEFATLRSKFLTANVSSKSRALPKVFTEHGLYMLATILKDQGGGLLGGKEMRYEKKVEIPLDGEGLAALH